MKAHNLMVGFRFWTFVIVVLTVLALNLAYVLFY